ncbi:hypothetical protein PMZ80_006349 [Knufia obscura]|uniref:FAD-binding PCMH-type domain-containing protein n=2 Tax=Knufia TaxID=430999 RepID=A0AAN8ETQ8_9EURO|nr:hypothetical protein PMZ80_006349 [Knufia obscura]KAK5953506.1 hypothetical protein OHC33_005450 [Knufia fluminis]
MTRVSDADIPESIAFVHDSMSALVYNIAVVPVLTCALTFTAGWKDKMPSFTSVVGLFLSVASLCVGLPTPSASQTCEDLFKIFPNNVAYSPLDLAHWSPASFNFIDSVKHYWNAGHGQLIPACVFYPTNAIDVSRAVEVLNRYPTVKWAAKSGGHNANKDWSSVDGGVLISFRPYMQDTTYNLDGTASVRPGARWSEAVAALEPYSVTVVGGRIGDVGVGGYTLGGGLSFLSSQYGLACDMVVEFEVVLPDGTIATINDSENTDLFFALKGGGNQFAIVTSFKMKTVPIGQVWGGIKIYTGDKASAIIDATHEFAADYSDVKAAIMPTFETLLWGLTEVFVVFHFYDGRDVLTGVFDRFDAIDALIDLTKTQSYSNLLAGNNAANIYGFNYLIRAQTLPLLAGDDGRQLLQYQYNSFNDYAQQTQPQNLDLMVFSFAMQPLPVEIQNASLSSGAQNTFAFDVADGNRMWMEYDVAWVNPLSEGNAYQYANHFTEDIVQYAQKTYPGAVSTHQTNQADQYSPLFLNDVMFDQPTSSFYRPDVYQRLVQIQKSRDPDGFFSKRTGGAKFT